MTSIVPWKPFEIMDRLDDELIIREIKGEVVKTLVYSFTGDDGKKQMGLSKVGVDTVAADMAKQGDVLRELELQKDWEPGGKALVVTVKAGRFLVADDGREILLETVFGAKRQPIQMEVYKKDQNGDKIIGENGAPVKILVDDPFYLEKGISKAARNAKRRLMPETLITKVIEAAVSKKQVKDIDSEVEGSVKSPKATHGICPIHGVAWKQYSKGGRIWYAHKDGANWCNKSDVDKQLKDEVELVEEQEAEPLADNEQAVIVQAKQEAPPYLKDIGAFYDYCAKRKDWVVIDANGKPRPMMPRDIASEINVLFKDLADALDTDKKREDAWRIIKAVRG